MRSDGRGRVSSISYRDGNAILRAQLLQKRKVQLT
jgi:hypothetical protein